MTTINYQLYTVYHTILRNIGLYTSIGLAILGSSRYYIGKNKQILNHIFLILLSSIFILYSVIINIFATNDLKTQLQDNPILIKWIHLFKGILIFDVLLLLYIIYIMITFV